MRSRFVTALAGVTLLAGCAGVGGGDSGGGSGSTSGAAPSGTLKITGFGGEDEVGQSRVAAFKQAYPDVTVSNAKGDFDAQQFLTALASGNPPDLVYMDRNLVGTYAKKGAVVPLEDCIKNQQIDTAQYREAAMKQVTLADKVYGIPEFYVVTTNLVDAKSLKAAGLQPSDIQTKDWNALKATSAKLFKSNGSKLERIGFDPKLPEYFPLWATANGATIIKDDGAPNLNDPKAVEALDYAVGLVRDQGGWTSFKSFRDAFDIFGEKNPLSAGAVVAFPMENWYVNVLRDLLGSGLQLDSTQFTDHEGKPVSMVGGSAWAIPKGAKNAGAACAWAKTMTDKATWMKGLNASPAGAEIDAAWRSAASRVLGGQTAQQALDQAQKEAEAAFSKANGNG